MCAAADGSAAAASVTATTTTIAATSSVCVCVCVYMVFVIRNRQYIKWKSWVVLYVMPCAKRRQQIWNYENWQRANIRTNREEEKTNGREKKKHTHKKITSNPIMYCAFWLPLFSGSNWAFDFCSLSFVFSFYILFIFSWCVCVCLCAFFFCSFVFFSICSCVVHLISCIFGAFSFCPYLYFMRVSLAWKYCWFLLWI